MHAISSCPPRLDISGEAPDPLQFGPPEMGGRPYDDDHSATQHEPSHEEPYETWSAWEREHEQKVAGTVLGRHTAAFHHDPVQAGRH
jgi:hypothetical protein